jgi:hypothetical protein
LDAAYCPSAPLFETQQPISDGTARANGARTRVKTGSQVSVVVACDIDDEQSTIESE